MTQPTDNTPLNDAATDDTSCPVGREVVWRHWPLDGPYSAERIEEAAGAVSELVRYLRSVTDAGAPIALRYAAYGSGMVGELAATARLQVQLLRQLSSWAQRLATDPTLRHEQHSTEPELAREVAAASATTAAAAFAAAAELTGHLAAELTTAHYHLDRLHHGGDS